MWQQRRRTVADSQPPRLYLFGLLGDAASKALMLAQFNGIERRTGVRRSIAGHTKESKIKADIRPVNTELYYKVHTPTNA